MKTADERKARCSVRVQATIQLFHYMGGKLILRSRGHACCSGNFAIASDGPLLLAGDKLDMRGELLVLEYVRVRLKLHE